MVSIKGQFKMGRTEVTVAMWKEYCAATGKSMPTVPPHGWVDNHPMVRVSQLECIEFATWAGLRLPSDAEWVLAATSGDGRNFPWGGYGSNNDPNYSLRLYGGWDPDKCINYINSPNGPSPVGSKPAGNSPYGCMDMVGNVSEWTTDTDSTVNAIRRGGHWATVHQYQFSTEENASYAHKSYTNTDTGFRLAGPQ
jgi:iron(II)-dependent oxidoreductase